MEFPSSSSSQRERVMEIKKINKKHTRAERKRRRDK
jgi:hypothetical protein